MYPSAYSVRGDLTLMMTNNPFYKLPVCLTAIALYGYAVLMPLLIEGGTVSDAIPCLSV